MRIARAAAALVVLGSVSACAGRTPYNPFLTPKSEIAAKTKTVALTPVTVPDQVTDPGPIAARYDSLIAEELRAAGLTVIPSREFDGLWKRIRDSIGGVYDARTGKVDTVKQDAARTLAMRELKERFNADGWLQPVIVVTGAAFGSGTARWDGVKESYESTVMKLLAFVGRVHAEGTAPALSLEIRLEDMQGLPEYQNLGGIQLLQKPRFGKFVAVPRSELFADPARDRTAVHIALAPLLERGQLAEK